MIKIEWTDELKLGIKEIDDQHYYLVQLINDFYSNIKQDPNSDLLPDILQKMKNYAIFHFRAEEGFLVKCNYPEIERHISEHEQYINKIEEIEAKLKRDHMVLTYNVILYLKEWINGHIKVSDRAYVDCLKNNGIIKLN